MIKRKLKLVVSFVNTENAMAAEDFCHREDLPGRLIPIPSEITAGCGLAWMADVTDRTVLTEAFSAEGIKVQGIYELMI